MQPLRAALTLAAKERRKQWLADCQQKLHELEWAEREER